jgi:transcriptional regulator with XRE-family HTH domain
MAMSEKIRIILVKKKMNVSELADKMGTSRSNLSNKLKRDNFSENELIDIANALNCDFVGSFRFRDTDEII